MKKVEFQVMVLSCFVVVLKLLLGILYTQAFDSEGLRDSLRKEGLDFVKHLESMNEALSEAIK